MFNRSHVLTLAAAFFASGALADDQTKEFDRDYFWHQSQEQMDKHNELIGKDMPKLDLAEWMNGPIDVKKDLKGKVVLIDLWATWCGPCIRGIPHLNELHEEFKDDGLVIIGVCSSNRGQELMSSTATEHGIKYPIAKDLNLITQKAWNLMWYPTYGVVDHKGKLRALGLKPDAVDHVIKKLLKERADDPSVGGADNGDGASTAPSDPFAALLEGDAAVRDRLVDLHGASVPPGLQVTNWINSRGLELGDLKGKVVMLDFWATWCGPCKAAVPHTNELAEKYADDGLVIIGVCATRGAEIMAQTVEELGIKYPVAADVDGATVSAYAANGFPDYYFIDRSGRLRIADCANNQVDKAIELLLAEKE
jgi:thiol-disulfide isomerase/thioredoxin